MDLWRINRPEPFRPSANKHIFSLAPFVFLCFYLSNTVVPTVVVAVAYLDKGALSRSTRTYHSKAWVNLKGSSPDCTLLAGRLLRRNLRVGRRAEAVRADILWLQYKHGRTTALKSVIYTSLPPSRSILFSQ